MSDLYSRSTIEYCERVGNYFYSEPINALSNLAFYLTAFLIFRLYKSNKIKNHSYWLLFGLSILIGTGSLLWHTLRTPITHAMDAVPIWLFFILFIYLLLQKLSNSKKLAIILLAIFALLQLIISFLFPELLNGSIRHIANGVTFSLIAFWFYKKYLYISKNLLFAFVLYISAIILRTIDSSICTHFPIGTHFLWHLFNALALYFAVKLLVEIDNKASQ